MNKIFVSCGNDIVSSRKAFLEHIQSLTSDNYELIRTNGKELTAESLELSLFSSSLFGQKKALAIENFLSGPKSKEKEKIINKIATLLDCDIVIWEDKEFTKAEQQKFPENFAFKNYKLPSTLFNFLGSLSPGKTKANLELFHKVIQDVDPGFVFLMLIRQVRFLILASENELSGKPSWQSEKLLKQAKLFKKQDLTKIYEKLLEIDYKQKTSQIIKNLVYELDLLISDI